MKYAVERKRVLQELAWETFVVGAYANTSDERMAILRTLVALAETEAARGGARPNDGNSARALLPRLINATRSVRTPYADEGFRLGDELLKKLASEMPPVEAVVEAVLGVLLSVRIEDTWSEGDNFHFGVGVVRPESSRGRWVLDACEQLWAIAKDPTRPHRSRLLALGLLAQHHHTLNYVDLHPNRQDATAPAWSFLLRAHLEHARSMASQGALDTTIWFALRSIWEWHATYDDNPELKAIALEAEASFRAEPSRGIFASLLIDDDHTGTAINAVASQLRQHTADEVARFFDSGCDFVGADEEHAWRKRKLEAVAWAIVEVPPLTDDVRTYMTAAFTSGGSRQLPFAFEMLTGRLHQLRTNGDDAAVLSEVRSALASAGDDETRRQICDGVYVSARMSALRSIRPVECEVILEHVRLFDVERKLLLMGRAFAVDASRVRAYVEATFDEVFNATPFKFKHALNQFCFGIHVFTIGADAPLFPQAEYEWLLDQFARLPKTVPFAELGDMDDIVELYPKFDIPWLGRLVFKRIERLQPLMERDREIYKHDEAVWVLTDEFPFADLVAPLTKDQAIRAEDRLAIEELIGLRSAPQSVSYHLPDMLAALDPDGILVPELVCERIRLMPNPSWRDLANWAEFASAYFFNSEPWRRIAIEVCSIANTFDDKDAAGAYRHLALHREGVYKARPGSVPERYFNNVELAQQQLADESDPTLQPFRAWRLKRAELALRREEGRIAEERGRSEDE